MAENDIEIGISANTDDIKKSLDNVAKQIAKFSKAVTIGLDGIADSLNNVADAAKGMGSNVADNAKRGTAELKKLEDQAKKTANISSTGPSGPLSDAGVARVQSAMADSPRQAQEQLNAELQRELEARRQIQQAQAESVRATEESAKQQKANAAEAARTAKAIQQQEKAEAELINKTAIANVLFIRKEKNAKAVGDQSDRIAAGIAKVTPAIQQSINALPRLRYALFDVARGATILSASLTAIALAPAALAVTYEREFADVQRTTGLAGVELERLRQDFIKLKQDIPISWKEITDIGALAGQLGISSNLIADFTASVARFAATTDLSVTQSATLFGRLNQLISGVDGQFEKLSSAINKVGVISVATESQIGAIAQEIASIANLSGFAADEIVGLSGALASLGIQPNLARGFITRFFGNINRSISLTGRNLEEFGRLTNRSAEEFAQSWADSPAEALIDIFRGIDREGGRAERTLRELGITSVRDTPAILRLAQNSELVAELIRESADAFELGTESIEQYNAITGTLSERLKLLSQNFQLLIAISGETTAGAFAPLVDKANELVKAFIAITNNPVAKFGLFLASVIALVVAGFVGFIGALAFAGAKASGLVTALIDTQKALLGTSASAKIAEVGLFGYAKATIAAATQTRLFLNVFKGFVIISALTTLFALAGAAINSYAKAQRDAGQRARDYFGEISSFTEAVKADTKAHLEGADAIAVRRIEIQKDEEAIDLAEKTLRAWVKGQEDSERATKKNTEAVKAQEIAFGDAAFAIATNLVISDEGFRRAAEDPEILAIFEAAGLTYQDVLLAAFDGDRTAKEIIDSLIEPTKQEFLRLQRELAERDPIRLGELLAGAVPIDDLERDFVRAFQLFDKFTSNLGPISSALDDLVEDQLSVGQAVLFAGGQINESASLTSDAIKEITESVFSAVNASERTQEALSKLGDSFREVGEEALAASPEIQNAITAILTEFTEPEDALNELIGFLGFLADMGVDVTGPAMEYLRDVIDQVGARAGLASLEINDLIKNMTVPVITNFAEGFNRVGRAARGAKKEVKSFNDEMKDLISTMFEAINASQDASQAIFDLGAAFSESGDEAFYASREMQRAISSIVGASNSGEEAVANLSALLSQLSRTAGVSSPSLDILREVIERVGTSAGLSAQRIQQLIASAGGGLANVSLRNFGRGIESVAKQVRTLLDFAGDLGGVISRAFDIRFKSILSMDKIADTWEQLNDEVEKTTNNLLKLSADRSVKEYFLGIAEAYGDSLRADVLTAELAEIDKEIREAQDSLSREVIGDSRAARQNRALLTGLVSEYQDYIVALAESGAGQDELREAVSRSRRDFEEQARQLGFSEQVIQQFGAAFDDVTVAINNVPRNITVEANVNPALQALNELNASLEKQIRAANDLNRALNQPVAPRVSAQQQQQQQQQAPTGSGTPLLSAGRLPVPSRTPVGDVIFGGAPRVTIDARLIQFQRELTAQVPGFATGGFTGRGGKMEPAGIVHRGEYVVPKRFVNQSTGMPDPSFLAQMQNGMRNYFNGGFVGGGGMGDGTVMVELSPYDRKLLADAGNVQLRLNGRVVAEATNQNNFEQARRGSD